MRTLLNDFSQFSNKNLLLLFQKDCEWNMLSVLPEIESNFFPTIDFKDKRLTQFIRNVISWWSKSFCKSLPLVEYLSVKYGS